MGTYEGSTGQWTFSLESQKHISIAIELYMYFPVYKQWSLPGSPLYT